MNNVIFLGAGASKADGAPLQKELFKQYFTMCDNLDEEARDRKNFFNNEGMYIDAELINNYMKTYGRNRTIVENFFRNFFGEEYDKNLPTFEEALGILELALQRDEAFNARVFQLTDYRKALIEAIRWTLSYGKEELEGNFHNALVQNLLNSGKCCGQAYL